MSGEDEESVKRSEISIAAGRRNAKFRLAERLVGKVVHYLPTKHHSALVEPEPVRATVLRARKNFAAIEVQVRIENLAGVHWVKNWEEINDEAGLNWIKSEGGIDGPSN